MKNVPPFTLNGNSVPVLSKATDRVNRCQWKFRGTERAGGTSCMLHVDGEGWITSVLTALTSLYIHFLFELHYGTLHSNLHGRVWKVWWTIAMFRPTAGSKLRVGDPWFSSTLHIFHALSGQDENVIKLNTALRPWSNHSDWNDLQYIFKQNITKVRPYSLFISCIVTFGIRQQYSVIIVFLKCCRSGRFSPFCGVRLLPAAI